jgi:hypothetical protein
MGEPLGGSVMAKLGKEPTREKLGCSVKTADAFERPLMR